MKLLLLLGLVLIVLLVLLFILCLFLLGYPDINECDDATAGGCEGVCCNTIGSYYCKCPDGFRLGPDGRTCHGEKRIN